MDAYALVTMKYVDNNGDKATAPAGSVFADFDKDKFDGWAENGYVRKATVGEVAEAKAAWNYRGAQEKKVKAGKRAPKSKAAKVEKVAEPEGSDDQGDDDLA